MSDIDALAGLSDLLKNVADKPQVVKKAKSPESGTKPKPQPAPPPDAEPAQAPAPRATSEADSRQPPPDLATVMERLNGIDARVEDIYREVQLLQAGLVEEDQEEQIPSPLVKVETETATDPAPQQTAIQLPRINEEALLEAAVGKLFKTSMQLRMSFAMLLGAFLAVITFALGMGYGVVIENGKYPFWYSPGASTGFAGALVTVIAAPAGVLLLPVIAGALWLASKEFHAEGHMQYARYCRWASLAILLLAVAAPFLV